MLDVDEEAGRMADHAVAHDAASVYEPSLFGYLLQKIGMWLFLLSDSLTFGALLYAYAMGASRPKGGHAVHSESIVNATIMTAFLLTSSLTMVLAVRASVHRDAKAQTLWLLATMICGTGFIVLHGRSGAISSRQASRFRCSRGSRARSCQRIANVSKTVPQFAATFFGLTGMHMLHVTLGVVYLGVVALRRNLFPFYCLLAGCMAGLAVL